MTQHELFEIAEPTIGDVEETLRKQGISTIIGVDEAGRGPLAGPVYAAAFLLDLQTELPTEFEALDDSKKLDESTRGRLYSALTKRTRPFAIASVDAEVIDEINILQATFRAMNQAVEEVISAAGAAPDLVLIDGNMTIPEGKWNQRAVVKGDARSFAIAAASVLAKVTRDQIMIEADKKWPHFGFASHKGYGTAKHRQALKQHGPCVLHRRSFAGVVHEEG